MVESYVPMHSMYMASGLHPEVLFFLLLRLDARAGGPSKNGEQIPSATQLRGWTTESWLDPPSIVHTFKSNG